MCFSLHADLVAGLALMPIGVMALREVRCRREIPFASLPLLFAAHQLVEALVWAGAHGDVSQHVGHAAAVAYVIYALPVLPTLIPLAVLLLEPQKARLRVAPFVVLGLAVSGYLGWTMLTHPVTVTVHAHALAYGTGVSNGAFWTVLYVLAVIGPSVLSGYRTIVAFGVFNLLGLVLVSVVYVSAFASFWCVLAGISSVLILLHMIRRRRLPDADRMHGLPRLPRPIARRLAGPGQY
jgi:hypothetical protein